MRSRFGETRFKSITQNLPGYNFFTEQYIEHSSNTDYIMYYTHDQFYFIIQELHPVRGWTASVYFKNGISYRWEPGSVFL